MIEQTFEKVRDIISKLSGNTFTNQEIDDLSNELQEILLCADVPYEYTQSLIDYMKKKLVNIKHKNINKKAAVGCILKSYIDATLKNSARGDGITVHDDKITVIGIYGSNGVGKTSFVAKLAKLLQKKFDKKILCVSFDKTRAAAQEQLQILCKNNNIAYIDIANKSIDDGVIKLQQIISRAMVDILIIDNPGISPDNEEGVVIWKKVLDVVNFDEKIIVIDATFGQNTTSVIKKYIKIVNPTGFAISKVDSDPKGGIFFTIATTSKKPIYYISDGEKIDSIHEFKNTIISNALFNNTSLYSVLSSFQSENKEYIQSIVNGKKAGEINYNDFLIQLKQVIKFGKFDKIVASLPNMKSFFNSRLEADAFILINKWISIISSMTPIERCDFKCLNISRMNRIARGSGTTVKDIITLKRKIEEINNSSK